jgi:hypothetical protein
MADIGRYPLVDDLSGSDQLLTFRSNTGQTVRLSVSQLSTLFPSTFIQLPDTPGSYLGRVGETLAVNSTEDGLEFVPNNLSPTFITLPDTPATFSGEAGKFAKVNATNDGLEFALTKFTDSSDTPASYTGLGGSQLRVNTGETGLEFFQDTGGIPNVVFVNDESDLPPVNGAGEHELEAETAYWITGPISMANPIRFVFSSSTLYGNSSSQSIINYTGSGYAVRGGANTVIQMRDMRIDSGADGIEFSSGGGSGSQDSVLLSNIAILTPTGRHLSIDNVDQLVIDGCFFLGAQGFLLSGAGVGIATMNRSVFQNIAIGSIIDFGSAVTEIAVVDSCSITGPAGSVAIAGAAGSANLTATGSGRATNNTVAQGVIATSGITTRDIKWRFDGNVRIPDSNTIAFAYIDTPSTTVISGAGIDTPIAGSWLAASVSERATVSAAGVVTFENIEEDTGLVNVTFAATKVGGGLGSYTFKVQKDSGGGYVDVEAITKTVELSSTTSSVTLMGATTYVDNDKFRLVAVGNGTSDNIDVSVTQFVIGA